MVKPSSTNAPHTVPSVKHPPERYFFVKTAGLIAVAAFLLRLTAAIQLAAQNGGRNSVFAPSKLTDLATYRDLAAQILQGQWPAEFYYQPFYYAVFLPLTGGWGWTTIVAQALLGALAAFLAAELGRMVWNRRAGYWAGAMTAISTPLLLYTPYCQNETLQSFHLILLAVLAVATVRRPNPGRAAATGLVLGIAILTRGNALLFLPGILAAVLWAARRAKRSWAHTALLAGAILGCAYLVQAPFIIYNTRARGVLTGPSTAADAVLALGNTPEAPAGGRNPGLPAGPMEYPETFHDFMARAAATPVARQMASYLAEKPAEFLELQFRKILLFWDYREIPNNVSLYGEGEHAALIRMLLPGRSALLLPLVLAGLFLVAAAAVRKRHIGLLLVGYLVVTYWGATALFYILSRFRAPILPVAFVFGGIFIDQMLRAWRNGEKPRLLRGTLALLGGVALVISANDLYRDRLEAAVMRLVRPQGTVYRLQSGATLQLDHGPFTGGAWTTVPLQPGVEAVKRFPLLPPDGSNEIEWSILATDTPFRFQGKVNGVPVELSADKPGIYPVKSTVPPQNGEWRITADRVEGAGCLLYDEQRDYGRSPGIPGEWIVRIRRK